MAQYENYTQSEMDAQFTTIEESVAHKHWERKDEEKTLK